MADHSQKGDETQSQGRIPALGAIYLTTVVTFCSLYAAQPIQPLFQQEFSLSGLQAILFTTLMMLPLSFAPLFYGYVLEAYSAKKLLRLAVLLLGVLELIFAMAASYFSLLTIRALQGLIIPAILTSLMSYISYMSPKEKVQQAVAAYIAATILGGFLGRFLCGLSTDLMGWRSFFFFLGLLLLLCWLLLAKMAQDAKLNYAKPQLAEVLGLLRQPRLAWLYCTIFCLFFVFAAMMNFLPFELKRLRPQTAETGVGLLYLGYSMGIVVALGSGRLRRLFASQADAIGLGIAVFAMGTVVFAYPAYWVMFSAMFIFCAGLFTSHALLSGLVNSLAHENRAIANGLYISFYYAGGTLGSLLPGYIYQHHGWYSYLVFLGLMITVAFFFSRQLKAAGA